MTVYRVANPLSITRFGLSRTRILELFFTQMSKSVYAREYRTLLERLRQARLAAGLTQQQVAKLLKKPQSFVSKSELGERRLDPVELKRLAKVYGKSMDFFLPKGT